MELPGDLRCHYVGCSDKVYKKRAYLLEHMHTHFTRYFCECGFCNVHRRSIERHQAIKTRVEDGRSHSLVCEVSLDNVEEFRARHWPLQAFKIPKLTTSTQQTPITPQTEHTACVSREEYEQLEQRIRRAEEVIANLRAALS